MTDDKLREELESQFLTAEKLYKEINALVLSKDMTYVDATIKVCDDKHIDFEDITKLKLVSPILMDKLRTEGIASGQLKQESMLPL